MQLEKGIRRRSKRIGRGGKRGKTSGKGHKGQKAHSGGRIRPAFRDELQRIPKLRGHNKNRSKGVRIRDRIFTVNVSSLDKAFIDKTHINPKLLLRNGFIKKVSGKIPVVKILGNGDINKSFTISECSFSKSAIEKVEKAGGKVFTN